MKTTHYSQFANAPFLVACKTTKTECGKRVAPKLVTASYASIGCDECKRLIDEELAKLDAVCKPCGPDKLATDGWVRIRAIRREMLGLDK